MKKWLLNIKNKLKENFLIKIFDKLFGIKQSSYTIVLEGIEAETLEKAIKKTGYNPKKWNILGKETKCDETST